MRGISIVILLFIFTFHFSKGEAKKKPVTRIPEKKQLNARRITGCIKIDGALTEEQWKTADIANHFTTIRPTIGQEPSEQTEIRVLYDNRSIYIGAKLHDRSPDKIFKEISIRDDFRANSDNFSVHINPFNDGQNIFQFEVSSANVQTDIKISANDRDVNWNAVWKSEVQIVDDGWIVEMEIPYSAIRFPKKETQVWGINFFRDIRRYRESSSWNMVDRTLANTESQTGELVNLENIKAPFRLALYPYVSGYLENSEAGNHFVYSAGMDLKYGITESFTMDMTLIPDFGQRKSDAEILNLSPFEVKYDENRQFFTEGTELFNKAGLFYSRRVGSKPRKYYDVEDFVAEEDILENPRESSLINATKISGRTNKGLGLGLFNAMTSNTYAKIRDEGGETYDYLTQPFTNYNILVLDQTLGKNSYVNVINTNVYEPSTKWTADVVGTDFRLMDKKNKFGVLGKTAFSFKRDSASGDWEGGQFYEMNIGKLSGTVSYKYGFKMLTDTYDPNDLGYLRRNNQVSHEVDLEYQIFEPVGKILNLTLQTDIEVNYLYEPYDFTDIMISMRGRTTFINYLSVGFRGEMSPFKRKDYYEPRVENTYLKRPEMYQMRGWMSTDYRKTFAFNGSLEWEKEFGKRYTLSLTPRFRLSDKLNFNHRFDYTIHKGDIGYVEELSEDSIIFGRRNQQTIVNTFTGSYVFNNKSSLSMNLRHYWSYVDYLDRFFRLAEEGALSDHAYGLNEDFDVNIFSIDLVYSWNFAPGSFMSIVWKNNIFEENEIQGNQFSSFMKNLQNTLKSPQVNSFSIKLSYYLDYQYLFRSKA